MSNTAFARQMNDLKNSGLNPLLAMGGTGASTPSGSSASAASAIPMENTLSGAISSGLQVFNTAMSMKKTIADVGLTEEQQKLARANAGKAAMETKVMSKGIPEAEAKNSIWNWGKQFFNQHFGHPEKTAAEKAAIKMNNQIKLKGLK